MNKKQGNKKKIKDIEEIAEEAEAGKDVSSYFSGNPAVKQRVNIDFSVNLLQEIDEECKRIGVTRQAWIKMACDERLRQIRVSLDPSLVA